MPQKTEFRAELCFEYPTRLISKADKYPARS